MKTYSRYAEQYNKRKQQENPSKSRLISQPNESNDTYNQFLEIQLEKVTNALLMTKDYEARMESLEKSHVLFEEKMGKFMSMVKLLQNFTEAQEKENNRLEEKSIENFKIISEKIQFLEVETQKIESKMEILSKDVSGNKDGEEALDHFRKEINKKIELVMMETQKSALNSDVEELQKALLAEKHERELIMNEFDKEIKQKDKVTQELVEGNIFNGVYFNTKLEILRKMKILEGTSHPDFSNKNLLVNSPNSNDEHFVCAIKFGKIEKEIDELKYSNHVINNKIKNSQNPNMKDLQSLEKSLVSQFTKGLEHFGEVLFIFFSLERKTIF